MILEVFFDFNEIIKETDASLNFKGITPVYLQI